MAIIAGLQRIIHHPMILVQSSLLVVMMRRYREMNRSLLSEREVVGLAARSVTDATILPGAAAAVTAVACIMQGIRV